MENGGTIIDKQRFLKGEYEEQFYVNTFENLAKMVNSL